MATSHNDTGAAMKKAKRTYAALILGFICYVHRVFGQGVQ